MATDLVNKFNATKILLEATPDDFIGLQENIQACNLFGFYKAHYGRRSIEKLNSRPDLVTLSLGYELFYSLKDALTGLKYAKFIKEAGTLLNDFFNSDRFTKTLCLSKKASHIKPVFSCWEHGNIFTCRLDLNLKLEDGRKNIELVFGSKAFGTDDYVRILLTSLLVEFCRKLCNYNGRVEKLDLFGYVM